MSTHPDSSVPRPPIFVIGTGRSGTTLLFRLLSAHPDLAWACQYMTGRPLSLREKVATAVAGLPAGRTSFRERLLRRVPDGEPYELWDRHARCFRRPCRDLRGEDVTVSALEGMRREVREQVERMGRLRFLSKYTGWSRIEFVERIFPGAFFVHIVRDGRAVASSLMSVAWWRGWRGPSQWRWGDLVPGDQKLWEDSGRSFFVLAGLQWKILMENITSRAKAVGARYAEVRYEDLVRAPGETVAALLQQTGLDPAPAFLKTVRETQMRDANRNWSREIPRSEKEVFEQLLGPALRRFGY